MLIGAGYMKKAVAWTLAVGALVLATTVMVSGQLADQTQAGRRAPPQAKVGESPLSPTDLTLQRGRELPELVVGNPF